MKFLRDMIKHKAEEIQATQSGHPDEEALALREWALEPDEDQAPEVVNDVACDAESEHLPPEEVGPDANEAPGTLPNETPAVLAPEENDGDDMNLFADDFDEPDPQPVRLENAQRPPVAEPRTSASPLDQAGARAGRAKTRILGFSTGLGMGSDPFGTQPVPEPDQGAKFPVAWLVVTDGPGKGAAFTLHHGVSQIGRGEGQTVRLDFGDTAISRTNHAAIAYDAEENCFFIGHGGKANLVRCNNRPVLSTQELEAGDTIRIGETTLRFVPLCGADFHWRDTDPHELPHAARG